jgi:hypothetical protein
MGRSNRVGPDPVMDISSQLRADDLKWMHRAIELARQGFRPARRMATISACAVGSRRSAASL